VESLGLRTWAVSRGRLFSRDVVPFPEIVRVPVLKKLLPMAESKGEIDVSERGPGVDTNA